MIDMAGLAQKGGAVFSHVKLARAPEDIHAIRVAAGEADLVLGCDLVVSGARKALAAVRGAETGFLVNSAEVYPGDFTRNADYSLPAERLKRAILAATGGGAQIRRRDRGGQCARRQRHRRQYVHARLCLPAGPGSAFRGGAPARDRTQRRGGRDKSRRLRLGPRRRGRSGRHRGDPAPRRPRAGGRGRRSTTLVARRAAFLAAYQDAPMPRAIDAGRRGSRKPRRARAGRAVSPDGGAQSRSN